MRKMLFVIFIFLCTPQQLYATIISYTFSGKATIHDDLYHLLDNFPSLVDFSGSFKTNTDLIYDGGAGTFAYMVFDFKMLLNEYNVYGMNRSYSNLYWSFNEDGAEIDLGYSSIDHDLPVDNISWSELYLHLNVAPENVGDFTAGSLSLLIVSDFSTDMKDMYFIGDIDKFESTIPVPEPSSILMVFLGLTGISIIIKYKHLRKFIL